MTVQQAMNVSSTLDMMLCTLIDRPDTRIIDVDYFSDYNKKQVLAWNKSTLEAEKKCIHEVFQEQVATRPNAEAVCAWDGSFTYIQLSSLASRLAHRLVELGVGAKTVVPLCFDKSAWNVVAMLAVLKAGGSFVPFDPTHPIARLQGLARKVEAKMMLCSRQHVDKLAQVTNSVLAIDGDAIDQLSFATDARLPEVNSQDRAYIIFTSGTTGEPKGTIIAHEAYCSSAKAHGPAQLQDSKCRTLQFAAHTFDASLVEILTTLLTGGCICIPSEEDRLNDIVGVINSMRVNWAVLTPSFIGFLEPSAVPGLKSLTLAGEAMSRDQITTWTSINLINGYGPSECAVAAIVNFPVTQAKGPTNIGQAAGTHCWVVDQHNHDKLVPVGCVGELLIEGPTLAQGYLKDPKRTAESFIQNPRWASLQRFSGKSRRMYKTGDLVRQNASDGSYTFVGRKDTQVKLHGQRIELGEIEHHLNANESIKHGLALLPKVGFCAKRIVAVVSLQDTLIQNSQQRACKIVEGPEKEIATSRTTAVREYLLGRLPAFMVPTIFLVVEAVPLLSSGKLDRKQVANWVDDIDENIYRVVTNTTDSGKSVEPANENEIAIQQVWGYVLNLPADHVSLECSFLSLGGDSITAIQVMGQCKKRNLGITMQDVLRSKSIRHLASCATQVTRRSFHAEVIGKDFDLSPIQQLYFSMPNQGQGHFNQSFFLRITRHVQESNLRRAIELVVSRHSMLRARFSKSTTGVWQQRVTKDTVSSYRFRTHELQSQDQVIPQIASSQSSLDITNGPIFAVDFFNIASGSQLLFMTGHHLVIDLVSWRVILEDVEELLSGAGEAPDHEMVLPFQTWCQLQAEHCRKYSIDKVLPIDHVPAGNSAYWGMAGRPNTYGDVLSEGFELDSHLTSLLLTGSHKALRTETVDLLLSSLIFSFNEIFSDREVAPIYTEGHGREIWDPNIDLSKTVGWFTVMYPVCVPQSVSYDLLATTRRVKDLRRQVPGNGRPYFASRYLTPEGKDKFGHHWPLEITFNYLGQYQQLEREGALLAPAENMAGEFRGAGGISDVGHDTPRFGLFEISAVVAAKKLRFSFTFNRHMKQQPQIRQWISNCQKTLEVLAERLTQINPEPTLSDFPLLSLTNDSFEVLTKERLPEIGVSNLDAVEDIYPCSPMQQGLLLSLTKDTGSYGVQVVLELKLSKNRQPDAQRLANAWQRVVDKHAALRTIFVESVSSDNAMYDQIVLKQLHPDLVHTECEKKSDAVEALNVLQPAAYNDGRRPPHRFTICETSTGGVFCKLEISHTIMDGESMSVILRDLGLAYEGQLAMEPKPLYSDYIAHLQNQPLETSIEYWKSYLGDVEPCHFPILNDGAMVERELQSVQIRFNELAALQKYCDSHNVTLSNAIHTAWAMVLCCYTGAEKVSFGYLTSGRDAPINGAEDAVGPFINMLVCCMNMAGSVRLSDVLEEVQKDYINSLPHRHTPLAEVQHALHLSNTALFNTALSYRRLPQTSRDNQPSVSFEECAPIYDPTEYNVSINVEASSQDAFITLDYWTDCLSNGQAANVASTFIQSLQNIIRSSDSPISQLDNLSSQTKEQIWNWNSQMPETIEKCVHDVVRQHVRSRPEAMAVCAWDATFTYAELDKLTEKLAFHLVDLGVGPETLVPTCFDKSAWTIVAMLSVLKAGGACVPLDATHPRSSIERRVVDTRAKLVLAAPQRAELFDGMVEHVVSVSASLLDELPSFGGKACTTVTPKNPCFVIYTSGSTGQPKGVMLEHDAIVTSAKAHGTVLGINQDSRVLQFAAYTFDNSLEEMFTTLMMGGCVCVPSDHDRLNNLAAVINRFKVNFMDITPTVAGFLLPSEVPTLKTLTLGGEAITKKVVEVWGGKVRLHAAYGPSECSVNCAWNGDVSDSSEVTNIGRAIGSVSWVVDAKDHDRLVPIGCTGELLIEGPIMARGYLHDVEKTAKSFIENPAWVIGWSKTGSIKRRVYKTGDLVRYNSNGTMTYLGRKDSQVKLNGQRIELGEIEHHVKINLPPQAQSAVELITVRGNQRTTKALAAFICLQAEGYVPSGGENDFLLPMAEPLQSTAKTLEVTLMSALASYMVPRMFIPVVQMPMTSSGKLDRRRLRLAAEAQPEQQLATYRLAGKSGRAPSTDMEKKLQGLWESVLRLQGDSIGVEDNFFRLGGDSITAMQLVTAARSEGVLLSVGVIFQKPKLYDMAVYALVTSNGLQPDAVQPALAPFALLKDAENVDHIADEVAFLCQVDRNSVEDIYPCTSIQEGLIALSNKEPGAYVAQNLYRLPADINVGKFKSAWQAVVDAEAVLRTRIVHTKARGFLQVVVRKPIFWNDVTDLQGISDNDRQLPSHNGGQLAHYTIVGEGTNSPYFVWTIHHSIYDGWCIPLIHERVEAAYKNSNSVDVALGHSYSRFIGYLSEIDSAETDRFWQNKLADTTSPQYPPLPHPAYQAQGTSTFTHVVSLTKEVGADITIASKIRAAWALVIASYSGSDDVVFGETVTGRDAPVAGIADMIGPTLATIPTRLTIDREMSIDTFLRSVQEQSAETMPYQYAGLQQIKRLSTETAIACGFQNLIAVNHAVKESGESFWDLQDSGTAGTNFFTYPLTLSCNVTDTGIEVDIHYDQDVIPEWQVQRLLCHFEGVLSRVNASTGRDELLGDLDMLSPQDRETISTWNARPMHVINECIHRVVERQVASLPKSSMAVASWDASFTYAELDSRANLLASHLRSKAVGPNVFVPLCFEKSAWTIVAMLAVLKSGGAFVPLDPAHPVARLQGIVNDVKAKVVICSPQHEKLGQAISSQIVVVDRTFLDGLSVSSTPLPRCTANSAAYVIFTSGTTGKPKGTVVEHSAFSSGAAAHGLAMGMKASSRVLQFASYTFDASIMEILTTLSLGGCVCVPNDKDRLNNISDVINKMGVTWTLLTPSFVQTIQPSSVPGLKTLVLGGEAMSTSHISTWSEHVRLVNAYGPSETAVVATVNPLMSLNMSPSNMGYAVGGRCWIADPRNHNRLVPIGSVGELLVEGPILARGYLNEAEKTADAFVALPKWAQELGDVANHTGQRVYKTGDLVKYTSDGSMIYLGRKDTQVKVRGQRLELGEVEFNLMTDSSVKHAVVAMPKSGPCSKRLTAIISLQEMTTSTSADSEPRLVAREIASFHLSKIRDRISGRLPIYMVPSQWVILHDIPLLPSGKLDRRLVTQWVEDMDQEMYRQVSEADVEESNGTQATPVEQKLREIFSFVLHVPLDQVGFKKSFLHLGGDSITAMAVMSQCRSEDLGVTVQDIISSKSIPEIASRITHPQQFQYSEEEVEQLFDLSPIQSLYFESMGGASSHFNQSVLLRIARRVDRKDITTAINSIAKAHSMLRARFSKDGMGVWRQRIAQDPLSSYRMRSHVVQYEQVSGLIEESQVSLDVENGPLFAVDLFDISGENQQLISIAAHHLVIDVVSWRIILQDLEDLLTFKKESIKSSLPFQTWAKLQSEHTKQTMASRLSHIKDVPVANLDYWGMTDVSNLTSEVIDVGFELDAKTTMQLLGTCNDALQTDIVDVCLASMLQSFRRVFPDRSRAPPIYNEGHGREPWDTKIDLSRTVGWFTTICPVYLPLEANDDDDIIDVVRWIKDLRRREPEKGREYFAYRLLTNEGKERFGGHWPMEISFNYLGQYQQLERKDALLQPADGQSGQSVNTKSDIGADVPRFALIEISASVTQGSLKVSFSYNQHIKRQTTIKQWISEYERTLKSTIDLLNLSKVQRTMNDFPQLPLTYDGLSRLGQKLPQVGLSSLDEVEDAYPCSAMQQGILLSQLKNPKYYNYRSVIKVHPAPSEKTVNIIRLEEAWQQIIQRHSAFRTAFIDNVSQQGLMDQVVLKEWTARIAWLECDDSEALAKLADLEPIHFDDHKPPHRLTICKTSTSQVFCMLEVSHAISDGTSMPIILRDLAQAYTGTLPRDNTRSRFSDYIAHIQSSSHTANIDYWKSYLAGVDSCHFPLLTDGVTGVKELQFFALQVSKAKVLPAFCAKHGITLSNVLQLVWALVLRCYTGSSDICFGYLTSGRDAPVQGIQDAVGAFINMLMCRMNLANDVRLDQALDKIQTDFARSMTHQNCSLADIQHEMQLSGTSLFNTAFTYQKRPDLKTQTHSTISFDVLEAHDPSEYSITVNVEATDSNVEVHFSYWSDVLSKAQAGNMASTFDQVLSSIMETQDIEQPIGDLNFFGEESRQQILKWNARLPTTVDDFVHKIFERQARTQPISTPAVCGWDGNFTYKQLDRLSTRLASHLAALGVNIETYVPICFEKSSWAIVAMLGIMKAGGAFVPLDPTHPQSRWKHIVESVDARLVLCSPQYQAKLAEAAEKSLVVDSKLLGQRTDSLRPVALQKATTANAAYIIFTSGTTGLPKGTIVEHAAFCTSATEHARTMFMRSNSRVFQFASYTFDASVMEILSTLIVGGCVCVPSDQDRMSDIPGAIERMSVTWTLLTPSVAKILDPKTVPSLKVLVTGGEAMSAGHIAKWCGNNVALVNAYGPSETAVIATTSTKVDEDGQVVNDDVGTIGGSVGGRNWVVDPNNYNRLVPVGGVGELLVEGRHVARGYLKNEKKTAEAFVTGPTWRKDGTFGDLDNREERMYRTGDLVRYNSDGTLTYIGRKDTQIKLNGQRIELGEIEHHVKAHLPESTQSAVELVVPASRNSSKALAAFFCFDDGNKSKSSDTSILDEILLPMSNHAQSIAKTLEGSLSGALPAYMIPTIYVPITKMPWTASGKLDRHRLRNLVSTLSRDEILPYKLADFVKKRAPSSEMEKKLAKQWENALKLAPGSIGLDDNFFRLGGDSVAAMRLVNSIRSERLSLTVVSIFEKPRLVDMATACSKLTNDRLPELKPFSLLRDVESLSDLQDEASEQCQIDKKLIQDTYPCSSLQEGLITLTIKQPGAYVARYVYRLDPALDINRYKAAWQKTVDEVDILRTRILHSKSGKFLQVVLRDQPIMWHTADDLQSVPVETMLPEHNGSLLTRYTIVQDGSTNHRYFVWCCHHALYDGWSMPMVLERVNTIYSNGVSTVPRVSYARFIKYLLETEPKASDEFWKSKLDGASPLHFPQVPATASDDTRDMQTLAHTLSISRDTAGTNVTMSTMIRAAWAIIIAAYTGSEDVLFGQTLAGRDIPVQGVTDVIGPTLTTVPTRIEVSRGSDLSQFLDKVQKMATDSIPYQHAGLQHIKRLSPDTALACDFQNLLVIQPAEEQSQPWLWTPEDDGVAQNFFTYPLVLECKVADGQISIDAHHDRSVISGWQVQRLLYQFEAVITTLGSATKNGVTKLSEVTVLSAQDVEVLMEWHGRSQQSGISLIATKDNTSSRSYDLGNGRAWIVDPLDHNRLAPLGSTGELFLEGEDVVQSYQTDISDLPTTFVEGPSWLTIFTDAANQQRQLLKTGDLAYYGSDGTILLSGKKDAQVLINGHRVELGEVEKQLSMVSQIHRAVVLLPKTGLFKQRLITVLSLKDLESSSAPTSAIELLEEESQLQQARSMVSEARSKFSNEIAQHLVPSTWVVLKVVPLSANGEPDKAAISRWADEIDENTYQQITDLEKTKQAASGDEYSSEFIKIMRQVYSRVLSIPLEEVRLDQSFLNLGGDSITAMQVMAQCRKEKITLSLHEVLRSQSLIDLEQSVGADDRLNKQSDKSTQEEKLDTLFELSPIQQLYFQSVKQPKAGDRFNQSYLLRLSREASAQDIRHAVQTIVGQHSMLRARFSKDSSGVWKQKVTSDVESAYRFEIHDVESLRDTNAMVASSQECLDVQNGPLFAADLFNTKSDGQVLFLVGHHLVVDIVSWNNILQDLEELLETGALMGEKPLPFQNWSSMQADNAQERDASGKNTVLPFKVTPADLKYWGMVGQTNAYSDVDLHSFTVSEEISKLALDDCHKPLKTDLVDLFLAVIAHSFNRVFNDRQTPTIFNEGHGREPWDTAIDPSRTVGWFTTITPTHVPIDMKVNDVVETIKRMKDTRRRIPENGRPYFAHRFLTLDGRKQFKDHYPMEIAFNYLGRMQQTSRDDALLQKIDFASDKETMKMTADVSASAPRFALFEVSAFAAKGQIQFSFNYNRRVRHQDGIRRWFVECKRTFEEAVTRLMQTPLQPTLSNYPIMPISYDKLQKLVDVTFPANGIKSFEEVENVYPCSPMQEGLLLSQFVDPTRYLCFTNVEVKAIDGSKVDGKRLADVWQKVVDRHAALRTVFVDSVYQGDAFNQIVVKHGDSNAIYFECEEDEVLNRLDAISIRDTNLAKKPGLPHQLSVCVTPSGRVFSKMEINHAVIDGESAFVLMRDLITAYEGRLPDGPGPLYGDYIAYIKSQPPSADVRYWKTYLKGIQPCFFPVLNADEALEKHLGSVQLKFDHFAALQSLCKKMKVTLSNVMQTAWALVLRKFTKGDDICFGYLTSGRDAPVDGIQDAIGAYINMLVCRIKFSATASLEGLFQRVQNDYVQSLPYQHCSLAQMQHDLDFQGNMFNTAVSIQNTGAEEEAAALSLDFVPMTAHDPSEYAVTLNIRTTKADEGVVLRYWSDVVSDAQAQEVMDSLAEVLTNTLENEKQSIMEMDYANLPSEPATVKQPNVQPTLQPNVSQPMVPAQIAPSNAIVVDRNMIKDIVSECVHRDMIKEIVTECVQGVLENLFKNGNLVAFNANNTHLMNLAGQRNTDMAVDRFSDSGTETEKDDMMQKDYYAPNKKGQNTTDVKAQLLSLWAEALDMPATKIYNDASFFQLGGDSLVAMRMVGAARDLGLAMTVADVFLNPVFSDMLVAVRPNVAVDEYTKLEKGYDYGGKFDSDSLTLSETSYEAFSLLKTSNIETFLQDYICPKVHVFRGGIVDVLPATDFQSLALTGSLLESQWMLNYFFFDGQGDLDVRRLKQSVFHITQAYDILRTVFVVHEDTFLQVVLRKLDPEFLVYETEQDPVEFSNSLREKDRQNSPKLGQSYLQVAVIKQKGSSRHRIVMRMSHAQYDGVCLPTILAALHAAYQSEPVPSTPDFSKYVKSTVENVNDDKHEYWRNVLSGSKMTKFVRRERPNYNLVLGETKILKQSVYLPSLSSINITAATILKAAWGMVLAETSASSDVVFGTLISGRNAVPGVESIIGPCLNLNPVRIEFKDRWTAIDLLHHIQDQQVANMQHESLGFREIVRNCTDWPDWTTFSSVIQHQNFESSQTFSLGEIDYFIGANGANGELADISITSVPKENDMVEISMIVALESAIDMSFAESLLDKLCTAAANFSANPNQALPTQAEITHPAPKIVDEIYNVADPSIGLSLHSLSKDELLVLSDTLSRAWQQILPGSKDKSTTMNFESSFFDLGGDIIGLAQVVILLEQDGFKLRLEDMIKYSTMSEQMALLSMQSRLKAEKKKMSDTSSEISINSRGAADVIEEERDVSRPASRMDSRPTSPRVEKRKSFWGKPKGLAKRIMSRRNLNGEDTY